MNIAADAVKRLRERTGAGMMECKKALVETQGDMDAAAELMRKQGLAKADKKAARVAAEGVIVIERSADGHAAAMVEVNCETDFVAGAVTSAHFPRRSPARRCRSGPHRLRRCCRNVWTAAKASTIGLRALVAKIGEKISVRRFAVLTSSGQVSAYVHGTRIGALVAVEGGDPVLAHDVAMHVAASNPKYVSLADVPADVVAKERAFLTDQGPGRGQAAGDRRQDGRRPSAQVIGRDHPAGQPFVKDPDQTIEKLLKGAKASVKAFERFEVGAGIEKKQDDFVAEVMAQVKSFDPDDQK
ncbi:MAG: translation elongation factor Ts [Steroidobacteraceae bacterium]